MQQLGSRARETESPDGSRHGRGPFLKVVPGKRSEPLTWIVQVPLTHVHTSQGVDQERPGGKLVTSCVSMTAPRGMAAVALSTCLGASKLKQIEEY